MGDAPPVNRRLWALLPFVTVLMGSVSLLYPHGRDQGSYAFAGWRVLFGELPYRDVFVFKPPSTVFVHTLAQGLFGTDPAAIRLLDLGWITLTAVVIAKLVHRLGGTFQAGIWAGILVPMLYFQVDYWNIAQTDGWMVLPAALALWMVLGRAPWQWGVGGALAAVAVLFKYTAGAFALPLLCALWVAPDRRLHRFGAALGGALGLFLLFGLGLLLTGSWPGFYDSQFELVPNYLVDRRKDRAWSKTLELLIWLPRHKVDVAPILALNLLAVLPASLVLWRRWASMGFVVSLGVVTVVMTVVQGKYYDYHYLPMLFPAAIAGGLLLDALGRALDRWLPHWASMGALWVLLLGGLYVSTWSTYVREAWSVVSGARSRATLWNQIGRYRYKDYNVGEIERAATWIRKHTAPDDPVFTWTYEPELNLRAGRGQVSRFLYNYPFRVSWEVSDYDSELEHALIATPPVLIVVGSKDARRGVTGTSLDSYRLMQRHPVLGPLVREHYCEVAKIGRYRMYTPCDPPQR